MCLCLLCILYVYVYFVCFFWVFLCSVFPSVLWYCWLGLLTCKTVSRITYTVLVEDIKLCAVQWRDWKPLTESFCTSWTQNFERDGTSELRVCDGSRIWELRQLNSANKQSIQCILCLGEWVVDFSEDIMIVVQCSKECTFVQHSRACKLPVVVQHNISTPDSVAPPPYSVAVNASNHMDSAVELATNSGE